MIWDVLRERTGVWKRCEPEKVWQKRRDLWRGRKMKKGNRRSGTKRARKL